MVAVCKGAQMRIKERHTLLDHDLFKGVEVEEVEALCRLCIGQLGYTMLANDDHRLALSGGDQIVHDVTHHTLCRPACLILTGSMHKIQHRETAVRLGDILRWKVYIA